MYQQYWGLSEAPFDNVPDPGMYFRMHASVENAIAELLFAIEEGNECLALLIGDVGLGKTMALRVVLDKLEHGKYRTAFVTNPDLTFPQLMREIIGQLQDEVCEIRAREELLKDFNRFLFEAAESGQKVLLFIDEGQALRGPVLESMRLLTSIQENKRNLLTIILAGQPELGTMLAAPRRANLLQRVGVCPILEPLGSEDLVGDYIDHRMERAGSTRNVFTNSGIVSVYQFSEGVPRLINRFCKLCLKAGETNRLNEIDAEVVSTVANQFLPSRLLQGLADARGAKEARIQQNPDEPAASHVAEAVSPSLKSTPAAEAHSLDGADAVEPDREVSVRAQLDKKVPYQELGLDPDVDYSDRLPSEPETSESAERSFSEDHNTETLTHEDQDIGPQTESLDAGSRIEDDREPVFVPEEPPADQNFEGVSESQESISGSLSQPIERTHAIKSDCRVSVGAQLDGELPNQEPGLNPDMDFFDRLTSELQTSRPADRPLGQDNTTESPTHVDQHIGSGTECLDAATETETGGEPQFVPARSEEPVSDQIGSTDPVEDPPDQPRTASDVDPPTVPPSSSSGRTTAERERKHVGSRAHGGELPRVPSSDEHLGQLRQRIVNGGKPGRASDGWVKGLFRGVFR